MIECDICFNSFKTLALLNCCKGKYICLNCKNNCNNNLCPFCRQNINRKPAIIIVNNSFPCPQKGTIIMSIMNYNIIKLL